MPKSRRTANLTAKLESVLYLGEGVGGTARAAPTGEGGGGACSDPEDQFPPGAGRRHPFTTRATPDLLMGIAAAGTSARRGLQQRGEEFVKQVDSRSTPFVEPPS